MSRFAKSILFAAMLALALAVPALAGLGHAGLGQPATTAADGFGWGIAAPGPTS